MKERNKPPEPEQMKRTKGDADFLQESFKYAEKGDVAGFKSLLNDKPEMLEDTAVRTRNTVLHVSSERGHVDFVKEVLKIKACLAEQLDHNGQSSLHLACASGHVETVEAILVHNPKLYMLKDCHSRIPLHCAVSHGKIEVMHKLRALNKQEKAFKNDGLGAVTDRGETALHLALKTQQEGAFLALMDWLEPTSDAEVQKFNRLTNLLCNVKDKTGNTVLHLASSNRGTMKRAFERVCARVGSDDIDHHINERNVYGSVELFLSWALLLVSELAFNREEYLKKPRSHLLVWFTLTSALGTVIYRVLPKYYRNLFVHLVFIASLAVPIKRGKVLLRLASLI